MYTENTTLLHCGKLTQWINGIDGKGIDMESPIVKVKVSGFISMSQENLDRLLTHDDIHTSIVYAVHMGYVDASELIFEPEES